jgi:serine/threonine-protein kinase
MGVVYKAHDDDLNQDVAIKTIRADILDGDDRHAHELTARLRNEVIAGRRLRHRNIVGMYEFGTDAECCFIVMEYIDGTPLRTLMEKGRRFSLAESIRIMEQILDALAEAHQQRIIHRDLKPSNIMLTPDAQVRITDFGIAKLESSDLTRAGALLGTPHCMAPEQWQGGQVDARTDLFAAGIIFYELLTGEKPFPGPSPQAVMQQLFNTTPTAPSARNVLVPKPCDAIVLKALAKPPADRYQSAAEFKRALQVLSTILETDNDPTGTFNDPTTIHDSAPQPVVVRSVRYHVALLLGIAAAAGIGYFVYRGWTPELPVAPPESRTTPPRTDAVETEPRGTPTARPSARFDRAQLDAVLANFTCARLTADVKADNAVTVHGHIKPGDLDNLLAGLKKLAGVGSVDASRVTTLDWPFCEVEPLLAGLQRTGGEPGEKASSGAARSAKEFTEGDFLMLVLNAPNYDAYLYVDYFQLDGNVMHLLPAQSELLKRYVASEQVRIGDGTSLLERRWRIDAPFGTELITVVAAKDPLFPTKRDVQESAKHYLLDLREALKQSDPHWLTADFFYIKTKPKPAGAP